MKKSDEPPFDPHVALGGFVATHLGAPPPDPAAVADAMGDPHVQLGAFTARQLGAAPRPPRQAAPASTPSPGPNTLLGRLYGGAAIACVGLAALVFTVWHRPLSAPPTPTPSVQESAPDSSALVAAKSTLASTDKAAIVRGEAGLPTRPDPAAKTRVQGRVVLGGAEIIALADAELHVLARRADGATLELVHGALTFAIDRPHSGDWTIHAGPYTVRVVGTAFRLAWSPRDEKITVDVERGRVEITDTRATNKRTLVSGGHVFHHRRDLGWPTIERGDFSRVQKPIAVAPAPHIGTRRALEGQRSATRSIEGATPSAAHEKRVARTAPKEPAQPDRGTAATKPPPESSEVAHPIASPQVRDPAANIPATKPVAPKKSPADPLQVAQLDPTQPTTLRIAPPDRSTDRPSDIVIGRLATGLLVGESGSARPLEMRLSGLGQLSDNWALGATAQFGIQSTVPSTKCDLLGDCEPGGSDKAEQTDRHQRYAMALVATARYSVGETQWARLALESDLGLAIDYWDSAFTGYSQVDGKKVSVPYSAEVWLTGLQVALRPTLSVPLGTSRFAVSISGEAGGRLGMAIRKATASSPTAAISPPANEVHWGGHLGLEASF